MPRARPLCARAGPCRRLSWSSVTWPAPPCTTGVRFPPRSPRRSRRPEWRSIRPRSAAGAAPPSGRSSPACSAATAARIRVGARLPEVYGRFRTLLADPARGGKDAVAARRRTAFERLRAHGIGLALTTGFDRGPTETILGAVDWAHLLDTWVSGDDVLAGRPAPFMIFRAMQRCGATDAHRVAVVGRHPTRSGSRVERRRSAWRVGVLTGAHDRATLTAGAPPTAGLDRRPPRIWLEGEAEGSRRIRSWCGRSRRVGCEGSAARRSSALSASPASRAARPSPRCRARTRAGSTEPTGASLLTPSVPRKSRSPSARTWPAETGIPSAVATARSVTPAQATSACNRRSPEQASSPVPPVAGCRPASTSARPVSTWQLTAVSSSRPDALSVTRARSGAARYSSLSGACRARRSSGCTFASGDGSRRLRAHPPIAKVGEHPCDSI